MFAGCAPDEPGGDGQGDPSDVAEARGRAADGFYTRELAFVAEEGRRALLLTSRAEIEGGGGEVAQMAWADVGAGWATVLDERRAFSELRDPWRLFPLGPARLAVGDDGALDWIELPRESEALRLRPVAPPTEVPAGDARVSVRIADLLAPGDSIRGTLVDAMLAQDLDTGAGLPVVGLLTASEGPVVVIVATGEEMPTLVADTGGDELVVAPIRFEEGSTAAEWRIASADTSVAGTLRAGEAPPDAEGSGRPMLVAGRVALAGVLYPLAGMLRIPAP